METGVRKPGRRLRAGAVSSQALQPELRPALAELVRASAPGRGLRRDLCRVAGDARAGVASTLPDLEGPREARVRRPSDEGSLQTSAARPGGKAQVRRGPALVHSWPVLPHQASRLRPGPPGSLRLCPAD